MNRILKTLIIAALPFAAMSTAQAAPEKPAQSAEVKKELKKLMNAYGAGEMSSKEYQTRKEALLKGAATTQVGSDNR